MKRLLFILGIILLCTVLNAQTSYYYYYDGKKQYLSLNTKHAFLSIEEQRLPPYKISQRYPGTIQEWIEDYEEVPGFAFMNQVFGLYAWVFKLSGAI